MEEAAIVSDSHEIETNQDSIRGVRLGMWQVVYVEALGTCEGVMVKIVAMSEISALSGLHCKGAVRNAAQRSAFSRPRRRTTSIDEANCQNATDLVERRDVAGRTATPCWAASAGYATLTGNIGASTCSWATVL